MAKWHGGKGSLQKPYNKEKVDENFDKIFKKKEKPFGLNNVVEEKSDKKNVNKR